MIPHAIFWHMMPRLQSLVLRRLASAAGLLLLIIACVAFPARHVLLPLWPESVEEVLVEAGSGEVERHFRPVPSIDAPDSDVVARSRPITLWRLETGEGIVYAWLAGVRDREGQLRPALPAWLESVRVDGPLPEGVRLIMRASDRETMEVDSANVRRMYRPNGLAFTDRARLWRDRLIERWRLNDLMVGVRMTPPGR